MLLWILTCGRPHTSRFACKWATANNMLSRDQTYIPLSQFQRPSPPPVVAAKGPSFLSGYHDGFSIVPPTAFLWGRSHGPHLDGLDSGDALAAVVVCGSPHQSFVCVRRALKRAHLETDRQYRRQTTPAITPTIGTPPRGSPNATGTSLHATRRRHATALGAFRTQLLHRVGHPLSSSGCIESGNTQGTGPSPRSILNVSRRNIEGPTYAG